MRNTMFPRVIILSACLLLGAAYVATASKEEKVPPRQPLSGFPFQIDRWIGRSGTPFTPDVLEVLGVDEYLTRLYQSDGRYADLYIGYYQTQRQGDTIHSPLNCLPGSGWEPLSKSYIPITVGADNQGDQTITVNRYIIRKGLDRQVVLYWYQSHGRVVANEYRSKVLMVYDAIRLNRTDAALVRVIAPALGADRAADDQATVAAVDFVKSVFPLLDKYLPS
jgi:EpsI family protein